MPGDAGVHNNLGNALKQIGQLDGAVDAYRRAVELKPDFAMAHNNLGNTLKDIGQYQGALEAYRRVLDLEPGSAEIHFNVGVVLQILNEPEAAVASYRRVLEINPELAEAYVNMGAILANTGQIYDALVSYKMAMALQPNVLRHAYLAHLLLPVIPESLGAIAEWRERYQTGISTLIAAKDFHEEPPGNVISPSFYLAYHNANDRSMVEGLCRLFRGRIPNLSMNAPHLPDWRPPTERGQRIRVGFLSEFLYDHTIGKHYQGFIRHLDRNRFEVVVIHTPDSKSDAFRRNLDLLADKALVLPSKLKDQQHAVAAEELDVLFYPDIGMSSSAYFLAYARLAPVQATSWGHPDTTGIATMDYYVSAVTNEPDGADEYYTERLIRLNRLPCFYYQTPSSSILKLSKAELGLPETGTLYGCPQSLFKIHPDFDSVLAAIAEGDQTGHLILPEGKYPAWTDLLKARWGKTFPLLLERVIFLPRMSWDRFMAMMEKMDMLLDPLHFGSGNTLYDAMTYGTPVVTWAGRFARGRNVAAAYQQMGLADAPIAQRPDDYAPLALSLGRDAEHRRALRVASVEAASRELFEDMQAVREFEAFLDAAVIAATNGQKLPAGWRPSVSD